MRKNDYIFALALLAWFSLGGLIISMWEYHLLNVRYEATVQECAEAWLKTPVSEKLKKMIDIKEQE